MSAKKSSSKSSSSKPSKKKSGGSLLGATLLFFFWPYMLIERATAKWSTFARWTGRPALHLACFCVWSLALIAVFYTIRAQSYNLDKVKEMPARSMVYASDGKTVIGTVHGDNRLMQKFDDISPWFIKALIAREDARFYDHGAVDFRGIARAGQRFFTRGKKEGASTITMQLADNSFNYAGKSIDGKLLEIALAIRIENRFSKNEILENYMNRIFWGHSIRGIEAASRTYFEKPASQLTLSESALLAGIIRGPNTYSPFVNLKAALAQRDVTLDRMVHYKFIDKATAEKAKAEELHIRPQGRRILHDSYAMDAIRRDLEIILENSDIQMGGLHITTTIDPALQKSAELAVEKKLREEERKSGYTHQTRSRYLSLPEKTRGAPKYMQAALVVIDNKTGSVKAIVGGRNADESKFNRALYGKRQIGSLFKPFVYMSAFDRGLHPGAWVKDTRIQPGEIDGAPRSWSPANSDGTYKSLMTVEDALARSRNTASVRIGNYAGLKRVRETARLVGFSDKIPDTPAIFLGTFEATPMQVAQAYSVFPNGGEIPRPYIIAEIKDSEGNVLYPGSGSIRYTAAKEGSAWEVSNTLQAVTNRGTAHSLRSTYGFDAPCAGKTGTTDNYKDAWFAGYTSSLTCAVWVGMDDNARTIYQGYGSTLALPIWAEVMKTSRSLGYRTDSLKPSFPFKPVRLCRYTSQLATAGCETHHSAYDASVPVDLIPKHSCDNHPVRAQVVEPAQPARAIPIAE